MIFALCFRHGKSPPFTHELREECDEMNPSECVTALKSSTAAPADVVEIGLLIPQAWARALVELSSRRNQSVGQILRSLVDHELRDSMLSP